MRQHSDGPRLAALQLGERGGLDDIGLLSDLLSSPASLDEHPRERAALLHAMQRLSGTTTETFDLTGVLAPPRQHPRDRADDGSSGLYRFPGSPVELPALQFIILLAAWWSRSPP